MKRIALVCFILFAVPVIFTACYRGGGGEYYWTYFKIDNQIRKPDRTGFYLANDTASEDTITVQILLHYVDVSSNIGFGHNPYELMATDPAQPVEKNPITMLNFGITLNGIVDTSHLKEIKVIIRGKRYSWPDDKDAFFNRFTHQQEREIEVTFLSPHNSKDIQFVTWAIKENGDALKAVSQTVFCK